MVEQPDAFRVLMAAPTATYQLAFTPDGDEGEFRVLFSGREIVWPIEVCEHDKAGGWRLSGLARELPGTTGADESWFVFRTHPAPSIEYWGAQVLIRTDHAA